MRLIDADELIEFLEKVTITEGITFETGFKQILTDIKNQPTAYDPEKVVNQLEVQKAVAFITLANTSDAALDASYRNVIAYLDRAIEIVRNGGAK